MPVFRFLVVALIGLAAGGEVPAQSRPERAAPLPPEAIKARYLIYFGHYVIWPADALPNPKENFVIGILGRDPFGQHLQVFAGEKVDGRRILVHRFESIAEYRPCHLLFISGDATAGQRETARNRLQAALAQVADQPVLTVTESPGLARAGAVINFVDGLDDGRTGVIRMEINRQAARRATLQIRAALLNLSVVDIIIP